MGLRCAQSYFAGFRRVSGHFSDFFTPFVSPFAGLQQGGVGGGGGGCRHHVDNHHGGLCQQ